ncbi:hypothetical protein K474DRAFT_192491 [Panus rudis PR-1116 ss-1]|nr:hypothetical protein K474DRAFT_192491 [Panus rudis PR-1116 ss-1]
MSTGSSLLSPAEALAFHGFLTSVDYGDALEWRDLTSSLQPPRGKEALAKATKDLMSLEASVDLGYSSHSSNAARETLAMGNMGVSTQDILSSSSSKGKSAVGASSTWPSFGPNDPGPQQQQQKQSYTYGFGVQPHDYRPSAAASSSSSRIHDNFLLPNSSSAASGSTTLPFPLPHSHSESSLRHHPSNRPSSPSIFSLPSSTHQQPSNSSTGRSFNDRPPSISASSAPSVLEINTGSKRSLPPDEDDLNSPSSSATSTQGNSQTTANKRRRSSAVDTKPLVASAPSPSDSQQNGSGSRQALLSPSQKRANHIQSEQKRRANIRRGYEALCEVVPALREAIKAEEAASAGAYSVPLLSLPLIVHLHAYSPLFLRVYLACHVRANTPCCK